MKFSVGLLSWKRVLNIRQIVDEYIFHDDLIDEIIIWNNNPEEHIEFGDGYDIVKVINCQNPEDFGLITRFCMGSLSKNPMIILQDDDYLLPYETLVKLRDAWVKEPDCFHTFFGRGPTIDETYSEVCFPKAPICGRLYVMDRKYCGLVLHEYLHLEDDERELIKYKGDDLLASYVMTHHTGNLHTVHNLEIHDLDDSYALSFGESRPSRPIMEGAVHPRSNDVRKEEDRDGWVDDRTKMMNFCREKYE